MDINSRHFYRSSSGDSWDLVKDGDRVFVLHTPNLASGGRAARHDLAAFLSCEPHTAQTVALTGLIGRLVDEPATAVA